MTTSTTDRPRCIHWHHIRGYSGIGQKIRYVLARLLGLRTPSADLMGCRHHAGPSSPTWEDEIRRALGDTR